MDPEIVSDWACVALGAAGAIALVWAALRGHLKDDEPRWKAPVAETKDAANPGALSRSQKLAIGAIFFLVGITGFGSVLTVWVVMTHR